MKHLLRPGSLLLVALVAFPAPKASAIVTWNEMSLEGELVATFRAHSEETGTEYEYWTPSGGQTVSADAAIASYSFSDEKKFEYLDGDRTLGESKINGSVIAEITTIPLSDSISSIVSPVYELAGWYSEVGTGEYEDIYMSTNYTTSFTVSENSLLNGNVELTWSDTSIFDVLIETGTLYWRVINTTTSTEVDSGQVQTLPDPLSGTDQYRLYFTDVALEAGEDYSLLVGYDYDGYSFDVGTNSNNPTEVSYAPGMVVTVNVTIPEPATGALAVLGLAGMALCRRRKSARL